MVFQVFTNLKKYVYRQNKYINVKDKFHGYKLDRKGWKILQTNIIKAKLHMANSDASASIIKWAKQPYSYIMLDMIPYYSI